MGMNTWGEKDSFSSQPTAKRDAVDFATIIVIISLGSNPQMDPKANEWNSDEEQVMTLPQTIIPPIFIVIRKSVNLQWENLPDTLLAM